MNVAVALVCVFSAGSTGTVDPPDLTSPSRFVTLANSSSTASPTTSAKLTTTLSAAKASAPKAPKTGTADFPSDVLDLTNWYLTLPTGTAGDLDTINQPALDTYTGTAFHLNDAKNGVVFTTTAGV